MWYVLDTIGYPTKGSVMKYQGWLYSASVPLAIMAEILSQTVVNSKVYKVLLISWGVEQVC